MAEGRLQATIQRLTTRRSPLSAFTLGAAGLTQALELAALVRTHWRQWEQTRATDESDPYFDYARSEEFRLAFLHRVGPRNYNTVLDMLILAADLHNQPDRLAALERLKLAA
jgi:hypothetical protein